MAKMALVGVAAIMSLALAQAESRPQVVEVRLDRVVHPVSAEYLLRGIRLANERGAEAVLLVMNTPGGLESSMRDIVHAILESRVPVITYVSPSGSRAASAGFFILLASDVAAMAPGTHTGAAHPVMLGSSEVGKTLQSKIENDAAAYIRTLADKRGRNTKLAEDGVRESKSYTENEALQGNLIDVVANNPNELLAKLNGKVIKRVDGSSTTLRFADAQIEPYLMSSREQILSWVADPNIAFILAMVGIFLLYLEFTHPGMIAPGVFGAIAIVLALLAFHLLPLNITGVLLILLAIALFVLEAMIASHGVLALGGIISMVVGAMILIDSPWPGIRISLTTALSVAVPLAIIFVILARYAIAAHRSKAVTGQEGLLDALGVTKTDLAPDGKVLVRGEIWDARADQKIAQGTRVRVRAVEELTLLVEPVNGPRPTANL